MSIPRKLYDYIKLKFTPCRLEKIIHCYLEIYNFCTTEFTMDDFDIDAEYEKYSKLEFSVILIKSSFNNYTDSQCLESLYLSFDRNK